MSPIIWIRDKRDSGSRARRPFAATDIITLNEASQADTVCSLMASGALSCTRRAHLASRTLRDVVAGRDIRDRQVLGAHPLRDIRRATPISARITSSSSAGAYATRLGWPFFFFGSSITRLSLFLLRHLFTTCLVFLVLRRDSIFAFLSRPAVPKSFR